MTTLSIRGSLCRTSSWLFWSTVAVVVTVALFWPFDAQSRRSIYDHAA